MCNTIILYKVYGNRHEIQVFFGITCVHEQRILYSLTTHKSMGLLIYQNKYNLFKNKS